MSSLEFNPSISFQSIEAQLLKPKMLVSPCNHMLETEDVIKIISSEKKECTHCKTEVKEFRTIEMSVFAVKVKEEIGKVREYVSKQTNLINSNIEKLQSQQQEFTTQLSQKDGMISELSHKASTSESKVQELEGTNQKLSSEVSQKQQEIQSNASKIQELQSGNQQLLSSLSKNQSEIESLKQQLLDMTKKVESSKEEKVTSNNQESKQEVENEQQVQNQQIKQEAPRISFQVKLNYDLPEGHQLGYRGGPDWERTCVAEFWNDMHQFYGLQLNSEFKFVLVKGYNEVVEWEQSNGNRIVKDPQEIPNFQPIFSSLKK